jgi:ATP-dependent DNA helicase RecG
MLWDLVLRPDKLEHLKPIEPVYSLTAGLSSRVVQKAVGEALDRLPALPGAGRSGVAGAARMARLGRRGPPGAHSPASEADLLPTTPASGSPMRRSLQPARG